INFWQKDSLVAVARDDACQSLHEVQPICLLCRCDPALSEDVLFCRRKRCEESARVARGGYSWEVSSLLVIAEEEEQFVLGDGSAEGGAKLLAPILRLEGNLRIHPVH